MIALNLAQAFKVRFTEDGFWLIYCGVMSVVFVGALFVLDQPTRIFGAPGWGWVAALPLGWVGATVCSRADIWVLRRWSHYRKALKQAAAARSGHNRNLRTDPVIERMRPGNPSKRSAGSVWPSRQQERSAQSGWRQIVLTSSVGVLEELVFRGVLLQLCLGFASWTAIGIALTAMVLMFALSHVWYGVEHVIAKLPLSVVTTVLVLAMGTVWPAVVTHVIFNVEILRKRRLAVAPGTLVPY